MLLNDSVFNWSILVANLIAIWAHYVLLNYCTSALCRTVILQHGQYLVTFLSDHYKFFFYKFCCPIPFCNSASLHITTCYWKDWYKFRRSSKKFQTPAMLSGNIFYGVHTPHEANWNAKELNQHWKRKERNIGRKQEMWGFNYHKKKPNQVLKENIGTLMQKMKLFMVWKIIPSST